MNVYRKIALWLVAVWMIGGLAMSTASAAPKAGDKTLPTVGQPAPDFNLTLFSGKKVTLKSFRGKAVLIVFWRSG